MNYQDLASEITNDPENVGYAPHVASGADTAVADLLNAPGWGILNLQSIPKSQFLLGISPVVLTLPQKTADEQKMWDRVIALSSAADSVDVGSAQVQALLGLAVSSEILTTEQV